MTVLIELKEKLKEFYGSCSGIVLPIVKFLLALAVFRGINSNLGYLKMLNSMYVVLILSLICAILPLNGMVFLAMLGPLSQQRRNPQPKRHNPHLNQRLLRQRHSASPDGVVGR